MIVSWLTTNRCNLRCSHCYQDAGDSLEQELTTEEAEHLIEEIAESGFRIMIFSGGEPLMRPDIFHLVQFAAEKGLRPVFGTNGTLISIEIAQRLKQAGAAAMGISIDSLSPEAHNRFRGCADAFERTIAGIENCKKAGLPFQIHTTVMDWNKGELTGLIDYAVAGGAIAHYFFFLVPVGRAMGIEDTSLQSLAYEETVRLLMEKQRTVPIDLKPTCAPQFTRIARQLDVNTRFAKGCLAGLSYCIIAPDGKVRPCAYMVETAGEVRQDGFAKIWRDSPLFQTLRTQAYTGSCGTCDYNAVCGGCRARAGYYHGGDLLAEDSYCAYGQGLL